MPCGKHHNALVMVSLSFLILLVYFVFASCSDVGALDASLGMKAQLALGRSWPLASHLPGAPASGLTEKKKETSETIHFQKQFNHFALQCIDFFVQRKSPNWLIFLGQIVRDRWQSRLWCCLCPDPSCMMLSAGVLFTGGRPCPGLQG